jgi:hypothetical protein
MNEILPTYDATALTLGRKRVRPTGREMMPRSLSRQARMRGWRWTPGRSLLLLASISLDGIARIVYARF